MGLIFTGELSSRGLSLSTGKFEDRGFVENCVFNFRVNLYSKAGNVKEIAQFGLYIDIIVSPGACYKLPVCTCTLTCTGPPSRRPRGLRRGPAASRLLGLRVRIPPRAWMSVSCERCLLSGTGISNVPITRPEKS